MREEHEHLRAGVISNVIFPVTAFTAVALFTVYVIYSGLVLGYGTRDSGGTDAPVVYETGIWFESLEDGGLRLLDDQGNELWSIAYDEEAYIHSTAQRLKEYRARDNVRTQLPFIVRGHEDGHVVVADPMTQRRVTVNSFGRDNAYAFIRSLQQAQEGDSDWDSDLDSDLDSD
ncbi:hypothetical protein CKO15_07855 [Halorhodospira abdelmalekii]|uniref:photosynthetic complex assembly protein PuhC n=1 Tax=Halorhodospira abdelmalekii TaxID=421629 RepID=UPI0019078FFA|nr:photosynthetic complex assembly protein PuhC [Halorhodospira abdelmalekii]MBK1735199.1 hypothetical protein [Halorhodospira abdelmalekii]